MKSKNPKSRPFFVKETLERDVLNRIKWDENLDPAGFSLTYLDRFSSREKEIPVEDISIEGDFIRFRESLIPMHRIRKILFQGEVVWNKRRR